MILGVKLSQPSYQDAKNIKVHCLSYTVIGLENRVEGWFCYLHELPCFDCNY